ncbi:hypothetical protein GCM10009716_44000 [Streptomyces sodiiphilus]|uniref:AMIN-like domain-containing protein n=1 Tax=Streptomyces sodiiphilus TaxID=226217 RepID=A0ABN2PUX2_9ACTN
MPRTFIAAVACALLLPLGAACTSASSPGEGEDPPGSSPTGDSAPGGEPEPEGSADAGDDGRAGGPARQEEWPVDEESRARDLAPVPDWGVTWVLDLRMGQHEDRIRLVMDIDGDLPEYLVEETDDLGDPDDEQTPDLPPGAAYLHLRMWPAHAWYWDDEGDELVSVYQGPRTQDRGLPQGINGLAFTEFEGASSLSISLDEPMDWKAHDLGSPNRIVLDLYR